MINKKLIIFTYLFPNNNFEKNFLEYELSQLKKDFTQIEIIPQKLTRNQKIIFQNRQKTSVEYGLSKEINRYNVLKFFIIKSIFNKDFWLEVKNILFSKNFFLKIRMLISESAISYLTFDWLKKNKYISDKNIFYSFWSNQILLAFNILNKRNSKLILLSRILGSDLNGFIKDDSYVPFLKKKFVSLTKVFVLADFQKKILLKNKLINKNKIIISPLGIYKQRKISENLKPIKELRIASCGSLISIKNNLLMIKFLNHFSQFTNFKIKYYIIGTGPLEYSIKKEAKRNSLNFQSRFIKKISNLPNFLTAKKINFFLNFSSQEGMSFSIMEALSCGIPVIASDIDANKNLVNEKVGYLISLKKIDQSFKSISKKIIQDLSNTNYNNKRLMAHNFANRYLINSSYYKNFIKELKNIVLYNSKKKHCKY